MAYCASTVFSSLPPTVFVTWRGCFYLSPSWRVASWFLASGGTAFQLEREEVFRQYLRDYKDRTSRNGLVQTILSATVRWTTCMSRLYFWKLVAVVLNVAVVCAIQHDRVDGRPEEPPSLWSRSLEFAISLLIWPTRINALFAAFQECSTNVSFILTPRYTAEAWLDRRYVSV